MRKGMGTIQAVGFEHYVSRRHAKGKTVRTKKDVMSEMRELARLYQTFQTITSSPVGFEEMFSMTYLKPLQDTMNKWLAKQIIVLKIWSKDQSEYSY